MKSIFVIGGGFVGVSTAFWLQRLGQKVTFIDRNLSKSRASFGNAGVLASSSIIPVTTPGMITKAPNIKGVFLGFGHQHVGLTGSAKTGQLLAHSCQIRGPISTYLPIHARALYNHSCQTIIIFKSLVVWLSGSRPLMYFGKPMDCLHA